MSNPNTPPRWMSRLHELLCKIGVPAQDIVAGGGSLRMTVRQDQGAALVATLRPRVQGASGYSSTQRFVLGYEGSRTLDSSSRRWMELILALVRRVEAQLPERFDEPGGLFSGGLSPQEEFASLFPFSNVERSSIGDAWHTEILVRATPRCNQKCPFCSAPDYAAPSYEAVVACIQRAGTTFPGATISLTGGEPTLRPRFADEVKEAVAATGIGTVQIQTNAVAFASKIDPSFISPDPRVAFFASLHAVDEPLYDLCTGTRGQLGLALAGIRRIILAGHAMTINCVVNAANVGHLQDYVRALPSLFPLSERVDLHFSTLICSERKPETIEFLVDYRQLGQALQQAADLAQSLGVVVQSLRSSTHAAIPACMLDPTWREWAPHRPKIDETETGFEDPTRAWVKAASCRQCVECDFCLGVPRPYAGRFGLDGLIPIRET